MDRYTRSLGLLICLCALFIHPTVAMEQAGEKIHNLLQDLTESGAFSGAVAIVIAGDPVVSNGYGLANIEHESPNTSTTTNRIGSITKPFTAMAILLLQASGYELVDGTLVNAAPIHMPILMGGGDLYSTVDDLQRWHKAIADKEILSAEAYSQMFAPGMRDYGYGWRI